MLLPLRQLSVSECVRILLVAASTDDLTGSEMICYCLTAVNRGHIESLQSA